MEAVAFFIGAMLARLLLRLWHRPMIPILLEAAIIGAMSFLPLATESAVLVLAFAMGLQASAITQFGGVSVSTVVVTSTLARTADAAEHRSEHVAGLDAAFAVRFTVHVLHAVAGDAGDAFAGDFG